MKTLIPINTDKEGNASTIRAGYFKAGYATLVGRPDSGFCQNAVIEIEYASERERETAAHERKLFNIYGFDGGNYAGNVYDDAYISPCLRTMQGGNQQPMIIEDEPNAYGAASSGRLDEHGKWVQQLEVLDEEVSNALTSANKDSLVAITDADPTIIDYYNHNVVDSEVCGTITAGCSHNGSGTFLYAEPLNTEEDGTSRTIKAQYYKNGKANFKRTDSFGATGVLLTIRKYINGAFRDVAVRIRKLTPKECWRLMGFDDEAFSRAEKVNSNSQLYKQAGNSIVVDCLEAIFTQLFEEE